MGEGIGVVLAESVVVDKSSGMVFLALLILLVVDAVDGRVQEDVVWLVIYNYKAFFAFFQFVGRDASHPVPRLIPGLSLRRKNGSCL